MKTTALLLMVCSLAAADTVVLRDLTVLEGEARTAADSVQIGGKTIALDEVLLVEGPDCVLKHASDLSDVLKGYAVLADRDVLQVCLERLPQAIDAGASSVARRLLERAERAGLAPKAAEGWDRKVDALDKDDPSDLAVPPDGVPAAFLAGRARANLEGNRTRALEVLRAALRIDGKNQEANALLAEIVPKRWRVGDARNWIDWELEVMQGKMRLLRRRDPDMERAKRVWRAKGLHGLETSVGNTEIVLITPKTESGPIGMCIRLARLTCSALEQMFRVENPAREDADPLVIYFYENRQEYLTTSGGGPGGPNPGLALTAGFYTPRENVSRFFWPGHPGAARSVRDTFVHELTHHWIERCSPRWHARDLASPGERVQTPGYWIVEGFAVFSQEVRFDQERGTWTHFNAHSHCLDVVAALSKSKELIAWDELYPMTQAYFHGPLKQSAREIHATAKCRWSIRPVPFSKIVLFYQQAGATCHFLYWGEGGKYREQFLDYVTSFYTSQKDKTAIETAFGISPAELGEKVEKFAIKVVDGWRPKGE